MRASCRLYTLFTGLTVILVATAPKGQAPAPPTPYVHRPAQSGYIEVNRLNLYYEIHGVGQPLLLLHGGLESSGGFVPSIPHFAKHYKVILLDRRGHGRSYDTEEPFSYSSMAEEVKDFLEAIHIESADVIGFSDGGVVGYYLASRYPKTVRRLVAVGANIRVDGMRSEDINWIQTRMTESGIAEDIPAVKDNYEKLSPEPAQFANFVKKTREMWLRDPYIPVADFSKISVPVLLIAGDRNDIKPEHMLELHSLLKGSQLCIVPNCDHFVIAKKNALFTRIALDFLQGR